MSSTATCRVSFDRSQIATYLRTKSRVTFFRDTTSALQNKKPRKPKHKEHNETNPENKSHGNISGVGMGGGGGKG